MGGNRKTKKTSTSKRNGLSVITTKTKTYSTPKKNGVKSKSKQKESTIGFKPKKVKPQTNYKSTKSKKGRAK